MVEDRQRVVAPQGQVDERRQGVCGSGREKQITSLSVCASSRRWHTSMHTRVHSASLSLYGWHTSMAAAPHSPMTRAW